MGEIHISNEEPINWLFDTKKKALKTYISVALYKQSRLHLGMHKYIHIFIQQQLMIVIINLLNKFERAWWHI